MEKYGEVQIEEIWWRIFHRENMKKFKWRKYGGFSKRKYGEVQMEEIWWRIKEEIGVATK